MAAGIESQNVVLAWVRVIDLGCAAELKRATLVRLAIASRERSDCHRSYMCCLEGRRGILAGCVSRLRYQRSDADGAVTRSDPCE